MMTAYSNMAQMTDKEKLDLAASYYNAKEYEQAYPLYLELAENGNAKAQCVIGHYYYFGRAHIEINYAEAFSWYQKSSKQGNYVATYNIGTMYEEGLYVMQNNTQAYKYYSQAGLSGFALGSVTAGCMLWDDDEGELPIDKSKTYANIPNYFNGASMTVSGGNSLSEFINAEYSYVQPILDSTGHLNLDVVPVSATEEWFLLAAKQDSAYGMYWLARYIDFNRYKTDYTHYRGMGHWGDNIDVLYEIAALHGDSDAQAVVGFNNILTKKYTEARKWLEKAKTNGAERVSRAYNINMPIEVASAICIYLQGEIDYSVVDEGGVEGMDISVYPRGENQYVTPENGMFYIVVENKQGKQCIVKLDIEGRVVSKSSLYNGCEYDRETGTFYCDGIKINFR